MYLYELIKSLEITALNMFRITFLLLFFSWNLSAQSFLVKRNIVSVPVYSIFEQPSLFGLSYERMLDKGQSLSTAQFATKLTLLKISDQDEWIYGTFENISLIDEDAYQYTGYSVRPELKYYFGWNAPFGFYFNLSASYTDYTESFVDINDNINNYNIRSNRIGRGIGVGFQFKLIKVIAVDLATGYIMEDVYSSQQNYEEVEFTDLKAIKDDGLKVNINLGLAF